VNWSDILVVVAIVLFVIAALGDRIEGRIGLDLVALGLAFWALSTLVP
jgi:uncharacterized membrane protein